MIKLSIYQEDKIIPNLHEFNNMGSKYRKQKFPKLEREIGKNTKWGLQHTSFSN